MNLTNNFNNTIYKKGFTLIELLIVISIIGILSSFLLANFIGVRQRARDGQRKSDVSQIQTALEMYRADKSEYPATGTFSPCGGQFADGTVVYLNEVPCDPLGGPTVTTGDHQYIYTLTGINTYSLRTCLENTSDGQIDAANTCTASSRSYTLHNP